MSDVMTRIREAEAEAESIKEAALRQREELLAQAGREAQGSVERARQLAEEEARQLTAQAAEQSKKEADDIRRRGKEEAARQAELARGNRETAIARVLERIL